MDIYILIFIHSSLSGHLVCSHSLATVNNSSINVGAWEYTTASRKRQLFWSWLKEWEIRNLCPNFFFFRNPYLNLTLYCFPTPNICYGLMCFLNNYIICDTVIKKLICEA